jgi:hypothetical protein
MYVVLILLILAVLLAKTNKRSKKTASRSTNIRKSSTVKPDPNSYPRSDTQTNAYTPRSNFNPPKAIQLPEETGEYLKDRQVKINYHDRKGSDTVREIKIANIYLPEMKPPKCQLFAS